MKGGIEELVTDNIAIAKMWSEAVVQRCSVKKVFLEISQNSQKTSVPESFLNKIASLRALTLFKKRL